MTTKLGAFFGGSILTMMIVSGGLGAQVRLAKGASWLSKPLKLAVPAPEPTPESPHVTIDTVTCRYIEKEPRAGSYADYQEERYCRLPLPEGAVLRRITAYTAAEEPEDALGFIVRMMDAVNSTSRIYVVPERIVDGHYATDAVACTSTGINPGFMALHERKKTFDCPLGFPADADSSVYVRIETSGKAKPEFRDALERSSYIIFPLVRVLQAEYEMAR